MTTTAPPRTEPRRWVPVAFVVAAAVAALAWFDPLHLRRAAAPPMEVARPEPAPPGAAAADPDVVELPAASWAGAGLEIAAAARGALVERIRLTGKIMLNEDRLAHIHPLVEGRVDKVLVRFGDHVTAGQVLVIVESTQVGDAKLELFQDRQRLAFATQRQTWQTEIAENVRRLIGAIRAGQPFAAIERDFKDLPMGDAREKLVESYAAVYKSDRDLERLRPLSAGGVVASKQLLDAETAHTGAEATLQALLEQSEQDLRQSLLVARQAVEEARTRVAVGEKHLAILGIPAAEIAAIDADTREQSLAQYEIAAPFDGTVIGKDVVLQERVGPEKQILSIADLATVWVSADIFEKHLPLVERLQDATVTVRADAWPDREFPARIFYTGDIIEEESRTIALRAVADNPDRLLKPGMFVSVAFPGVERADVLQLPTGALFEHEGRSYVFVHEGGDRFRRRDVTTGESMPATVEIVSGIAPGDRVVVAGGFALKSRLLAGLLEGE